MKITDVFFFSPGSFVWSLPPWKITIIEAGLLVRRSAYSTSSCSFKAMPFKFAVLLIMGEIPVFTCVYTLCG